MPSPYMASQQQVIHAQRFILDLSRLTPGQLFTDATTTILVPSVRSLGPLAMEQGYGALRSRPPLGQSILAVSPQLPALLAATVICFALSYHYFMRKEIRSR